jgi:response regulator RpfG family c-di-GMP phosphodiesterase
MNQEKITVLYVDDEVVNLRIMESVLKRDFELITTQYPKEVLEIVKNHKIDVIITDQVMPQMTGIELLQELMKFTNVIPPSRILLSGYTKPESIEYAFKELLLYKFIEKPFNIKDLKNVIMDSIKN